MAAITPKLQKQLQINNEQLQLTAEKGVVIADVVPNSLADQAGLKSADVIQKVNGEAVSQVDEIQQPVQETQVRTQLPLQLQRNGQEVNFKVEVGVLPTPQQTVR